MVPFAVGAYITATYWFTASTSFANPAVTLARSATDTFSGIRPLDAPGFVVAQLLGAFAATATFGWITAAPARHRSDAAAVTRSTRADETQPSESSASAVDPTVRW
jgi:glycerol uptake facilitator-like aquaporin